MEDIRCIFCDVPSDNVVIEENGYLGRQCPQCRLVFVSPRPSLDEIQALYGADEAHVSAGTHIFGEYRRRLIAQHTLDRIGEFASGGALLEIGSGSGYFLDEARNRGFDVYGIELSTILAEFTRARFDIPCVDTPLDPSLFDGRKFDVIYHRDVISHFYDPIAEFVKIHQMLNENGLVVFETGNLGDVDHKYFRWFTELQFPDHLFFFSEQNLDELLRRSGFNKLVTHRYSIVPLLLLFDGLHKAARKFGPLGRVKQTNERDKADIVASGIQELAAAGTSSPSMAKRLYNGLYYFLRYKAGKILPKKGRPQTLIVIARKGKI